jgi:ferredoxin
MAVPWQPGAAGTATMTSETVMMMRVIGNKEACAVSSLCVYRVPQVFDQDEEGTVEILDPSPPDNLHEAVRMAAHGCPTQAIVIHEDEPAATPAGTQEGLDRPARDR